MKLAKTPEWMRKWDAPLSGPVLIGVLLLPVVLLFIWTGYLQPLVLSLPEPLADRSPYAYYILRVLLFLLVFPWAFGPMFIALLIYQRRYDRKKRNDGQVAK